MSNIRITGGEGFPFTPERRQRWKRLALAVGVPLLGVLLVLLLLFNVFFRSVPPGHMLVVIAKHGTEMKPGQVLAEPGEKGIQRRVLGEGYHFIMPIAYTTEVHPNVVIEAGKVGVVTALGGVTPRDGRVLAEEDDEQGIRRAVLPPGAYRLNPYGYKVERVPVTRIEPGYVGVLRRLLGQDGTGQFAGDDTEKGIVRRKVLQPGLYYINTKEYEVIHCEVGIDQTTYNYNKANPKEGNPITFPAKDGNTISLDCTVEWEVQPDHWPALVAKYGSSRRRVTRSLDGREVSEELVVGNIKTIERIVIDQHARKISRDRGFNYGAQDFLEGAEREKFQEDFRAELDKVCKADNVTVRSAFIRNIIIPESFLEPKRQRQLAVETKLTSEALTETALSQAEVEEAQRMITQRQAKVKAETGRLVAVIERETENLRALTEAQIERLKAAYGAKIAKLDAQRRTELGKAEAKAKQVRETAKSELYKMKLDVFGRNGEAYLRYSLAQQLNPKLVLRLFHSGPGTLWTNLGDKKLSLMLAPPAAAAKESKPAASKTEERAGGREDEP
jgi:hypothetical protein